MSQVLAGGESAKPWPSTLKAPADSHGQAYINNQSETWKRSWSHHEYSQAVRLKIDFITNLTNEKAGMGLSQWDIIEGVAQMVNHIVNMNTH